MKIKFTEILLIIFTLIFCYFLASASENIRKKVNKFEKEFEDVERFDQIKNILRKGQKLDV